MFIHLVDDKDKIIQLIDNDGDDSPFDSYMPEKGEQLWIPSEGLYEVTNIRWMLEEESFVIIKLSFIRKHL